MTGGDQDTCPLIKKKNFGHEAQEGLDTKTGDRQTDGLSAVKYFDLQLGSRLKCIRHVYYIPATFEREGTVYLERDTLNSLAGRKVLSYLP